MGSNPISSSNGRLQAATRSTPQNLRDATVNR